MNQQLYFGTEFKIILLSLQPYEDIEFNDRPKEFGYDHVRCDYKLMQSVEYPKDFMVIGFSLNTLNLVHDNFIK